MSGQAEQLQQLMAFFQVGAESGQCASVKPAQRGPRKGRAGAWPRPGGQAADSVDETHFEKF